MSKKHTKMVIAYDFDGTLSPNNMQEYDFIPALHMKNKKFWDEVATHAKKQNADMISAYMYWMLHCARIHDVPVRKNDFVNYGKTIIYFKGVESWFKRINAYGKKKKVNVEHFIISSGIREMIEGTSIGKEFKKIYASSFMYDKDGVANWPALSVNYTTKTQYLFRINKESLEVYDDSTINKYVPQNERPVPFNNMVFIGDGETDIPCMRLVKDQGGHSIAVYRSGKVGAKQKAQQLITEGRTTLAVPADYSDGSRIDKAMKGIIDGISANTAIMDSGI